jgi:hypothetical protein
MYVVRVPKMQGTFPDTKESTVATSTNAPMSKREIAKAAQQFRERLLSTVRHGHQFSLDAAKGWVRAVSVLPMPDLPNVAAVPIIEATSTFVFDVAADLLNAQREYALQLVNLLVPAKSL